MQPGFLYAFIYIFSIIIATLWILSLSKDYSIYLLLLSAAFWSIIIFNSLNFKNIVSTHKIILVDFKNWAILSVIFNLFSQLSIQQLPMEKFNFFMNLTPLLAFVCNGIMFSEWSLSMGVLTLLATLSLNYNGLANTIRSKYFTH